MKKQDVLNELFKLDEWPEIHENKVKFSGWSWVAIKAGNVILVDDSHVETVLCYGKPVDKFIIDENEWYADKFKRASKVKPLSPPTKIKVFISGPMSGLPNFNRDAFNSAATIIKANGNVPLNPATLPDGLSESEYMKICLSMLQCADQILMLSGWGKSKGSIAEYCLAEKLGLEIVYNG